MTAQNGLAELKHRIKKLLTLRGFSQEQMAKSLDISLKSYSNLENDNSDVGFEKLLKIASTLEMDVANLVGFDEKVIFNNCTADGEAHGNFHYNVTTTEKLFERILSEKERNIVSLEKQVLSLQETVNKLLEK